MKSVCYPISVYITIDMYVKYSALGYFEECLIDIRFVNLGQPLLEIFEGIIDYFECLNVLLHLGLKLEIGSFFVLSYI